jgi:hypothetical protein
LPVLGTLFKGLGDDVSINDSGRVLPFFKIEHVPKLTALAASVYATMLFPGDEQFTDRFACAQAICLDWRVRYAEGDIKEELSFVRGDLYSMLDFMLRFPTTKITSLRNHAMSAGQILKFVLLLDRDTNQSASVRKATELLNKFEPIENRTIMKRWTQFKVVSHLWAAYNDYRYALKRAGPEWKITAWLSYMKDPRPVLAIADHYRHWGTNHLPKGGKSARTLEGSQTWSMPENIGPLPQADFLNPQKLYVGLTPEVRSYLEQYKHKV